MPTKKIIFPSSDVLLSHLKTGEIWTVTYCNQSGVCGSYTFADEENARQFAEESLPNYNSIIVSKGIAVCRRATPPVIWDELKS